MILFVEGSGKHEFNIDVALEDIGKWSNTYLIGVLEGLQETCRAVTIGKVKGSHQDLHELLRLTRAVRQESNWRRFQMALKEVT